MERFEKVVDAMVQFIVLFAALFLFWGLPMILFYVLGGIPCVVVFSAYLLTAQFINSFSKHNRVGE